MGPLPSLGRMLLSLGALLMAAGLVVLVLNRLGMPLGRLPGDFALRGRNFAFYAPIATCLLLSVLLSLAMWAWNRFHR